MIIYAHLTGESVGALFMGGVFPGLLIASLFIAYIGIRCAHRPHLCPPIPKEERMFTLGQRIVGLRAMILPIILIFLVLGLIYRGVTTPTEAAGMGAFGALLCVLVYKRFTWNVLNGSLMGTLRLSCMIMWILLGAKCFSHIYTALGAPEFVYGLITGWEINRWPILITMTDIYRSIIPFVILEMIGLGIIMLFPQIVLWLPGTMIRAPL
jgi:TRAP-type mannitol/chloroaromatic compound transport system permease large subunit